MIIAPASAPVSGENGVSTLHLSVAGGVTQFGAYVDTLAPGAWSSFRHWHSSEDEFVYVLSGTVTMRDDDGMHDLTPGDAVCWRHGDPNAHHLTNRTTEPCRYVIVGSRALGDVCTYPDDGRRLVNGTATWQVVAQDGSVLRGGDLPPELLDLPPAWGTPFDGTPAPRIIRKGSAKVDRGTAENVAALGPFEAQLLSDTGRLTQFGAFVETLMPGSRSSERHWHEREDEFLLMLDGEATVVEDDGPHTLKAGDAAGWPAGVANGHQVVNRSDRPCSYLIVGTRLRSDRVHYSEIDRLYVREGDVVRRTRRDGSPL